MASDTIENDLIIDCFNTLRQSPKPYKEPVLGSYTLKLIRHVCENLEQPVNVFVMSVEIVEEYLHVMNLQDGNIEDPLLIILLAVFLSNKYEGGEDTLKIKHIINTLYCISRKLYSFETVLRAECDILMYLNGTLPIVTVVDDLQIVVEKYMRDRELPVSIHPLCMKILEFLYISRTTWFQLIKIEYNENETSRKVFQCLMSSRFYLPVCIFITALKGSHYQYLLNMKAIIKDITTQTKIHYDHYKVFLSVVSRLLK